MHTIIRATAIIIINRVCGSSLVWMTEVVETEEVVLAVVMIVGREV